MRPVRNLAASLGAALSACAILMGPAGIIPLASAHPAGDDIVINGIYARGGSANQPYQEKFIELYNPTGPTPPPAEPPLLTVAEIQGTGDATPYKGQVVRTRAIITAMYETGGFRGMYLQDPGTGGDLPADHAASHGVWVQVNHPDIFARTGWCVEITGTADEYFGLTEIGHLTAIAKIEDGCEPVTPVNLTAMPTDEAAREALEGMLVLPAGDFTIIDNYQTNRYGTLALTPGTEPLYQATAVVAPGDEARAYEAANAKKVIVLDDGSSFNYTKNAEAQSTPLPYLSVTEGGEVVIHPVRVGAGATFINPVILDYRYSTWALQPTFHLTGNASADQLPIAVTDTRQEAPTPDGDISIASFNVLNYFTDLGQDEAGCRSYDDREGTPVTGNYCKVRGAFTPAALAHQQTKIVQAINALDASIIGLEEIEQSAAFGHERDASLAQLVDALNAAAGAGTWAFAPSPAAIPADEDVIRTAFIYQPAEVELVGESVIHNDQSAFSNAREPLAQAFKKVGYPDATSFVVIANHFKSKGSGSGAGNEDLGDGQAKSNADRIKQAASLADFATTTFADKPVFLIGDFNSYTKEDPLAKLAEKGFSNTIEDVTQAATYVYRGRVGSLDHALVNDAAKALVNSVDVWDVNADEPIAFEYSRENYNIAPLFEDSTPYRASDHDPIILGITVPKPIADPVQPTPTDNEGTGSDELAIPEVEGITYLIDGEVVTGTYQVPEGVENVTVTVQWDEGYEPSDPNGPTSYDFTFDISVPDEQPAEQPDEQPAEQPDDQPGKVPEDKPADPPSEDPSKQPSKQPSDPKQPSMPSTGADGIAMTLASAFALIGAGALARSRRRTGTR